MSGRGFQAERAHKRKGPPTTFVLASPAAIRLFSGHFPRGRKAGQPAIASSYSAESSSHCSSASLSLSTAMERSLAFSAAFAGFFS